MKRSTTYYPHNSDAERAVLGCALNDSPEAAAYVAGLPDSLFAHEKNRVILGAIKDCVQAGTEPNLVSISHRLSTAGRMALPDEKPGSGRITSDDLIQCMDSGPVPSQASEFAAILRDLDTHRRVIRAGRTVMDKAGHRDLSGHELRELIEAFQAEAFGLAMQDGNATPGPQPAEKVIGEALDLFESRCSGKLPARGISTGFPRLDAQTAGLSPGQLIIVASRPGTGKTSFALDVALHAARSTPVVFYSLEMSAVELGQRILAKQSGVNLRLVRTGLVNSAEFDQVTAAGSTLDGLSLFIDDSSTLSPMQVRSRSRALAMRLKQPLGLIVVDYLQIMAPGRSFDNREREIATVSREMKALAKDLNVPVLLLSQLNRELERRTDKRPVLADLRESGAIEQDADIVIGLFRPFAYTGLDADRHKAEAILLKQRNGPVGTIPLRWTPETASFSEVTH